MNIYDKKVVKCVICEKSIGEVNYDAEIIFPRCGECSDPKPHINDLIVPLERNYNFPKKQVVNTLAS
ncbi:MAG: hypothetical protein DWQ18_07885 [Crenarchaeota archaeon]|nr:MAG: hypothetical protein DWQ17_01900 [Thermoproteota archaeon]RDJ33082.1 MAG: hypothetical protein DWQ18_07885 [Thermoproteota archaeon]RDJ36414.1 MAG: hypothetical protein DWQ19_07435 [Thermoproteota archaeon]RDJ39043.1 MAG: hypothetical protein DWQ13_01900 [Thermoproteota archaeon]